MHISNYQIRKVLKVYSRQLAQRELNGQTGIFKGSQDTNVCSDERRETIINKIASTIFTRIIQDSEKNHCLGMENIGQDPNKFRVRFKKKAFRYYRVNEKNEKQMQTLKIEKVGLLEKDGSCVHEQTKGYVVGI